MKGHVGIGGVGSISSVLGIPSSIPILRKHPVTAGQLSTASFASNIPNGPNVLTGAGPGLYTPGVPKKQVPLPQLSELSA